MEWQYVSYRLTCHINFRYKTHALSKQSKKKNNKRNAIYFIHLKWFCNILYRLGINGCPCAYFVVNYYKNIVFFFILHKLMLPLVLVDIYGWLTAIKYNTTTYNVCPFINIFYYLKNVSQSKEYRNLVHE